MTFDGISKEGIVSHRGIRRFIPNSNLADAPAMLVTERAYLPLISVGATFRTGLKSRASRQAEKPAARCCRRTRGFSTLEFKFTFGGIFYALLRLEVR